MLKDFYSQPGVVARLRRGPLAEQLDQLVITLQNEGYARDSIRISIRAASKFSLWLDRRKNTADNVTDALVEVLSQSQIKQKVSPSNLPTYPANP